MSEAHTATSERAKYRACWADPRYRVYSPGEQMLPLFRRMVRKRTGTLLDLGCGTGRAGVALAELGFTVTLADFVDTSRDEGVELPFRRINIFGRWPRGRWDWVYCCDVLEHLPPERQRAALGNIAAHAGQAFFSIHFGADNFGAVVGHPLHLTIRPFAWWREFLREFGDVVEARDLIGMGAFRVRFG